MKKQTKPRNAEYAAIIKSDPKRIAEKIVLAEKGKGRKDRSRENTVDISAYSYDNEDLYEM